MRPQAYRERDPHPRLDGGAAERPRRGDPRGRGRHRHRRGARRPSRRRARSTRRRPSRATSSGSPPSRRASTKRRRANWRALLAEAPADAPWRPLRRSRRSRASTRARAPQPGPTERGRRRGGRTCPADERTAMIDGMVSAARRAPEGRAERRRGLAPADPLLCRARPHATRRRRRRAMRSPAWTTPRRAGASRR